MELSDHELFSAATFLRILEQLSAVNLGKWIVTKEKKEDVKGYVHYKKYYEAKIPDGEVILTETIVFKLPNGSYDVLLPEGAGYSMELTSCNEVVDYFNEDPGFVMWGLEDFLNKLEQDLYNYHRPKPRTRVAASKPKTLIIVP